MLDEETRRELKKLIKEAIDEHHCMLDPEMVRILQDQNTVDVIRELGGSMTRESAQLISRLGRTIDQVSFDLGKLLMKGIVVIIVVVTVWIFGKKTGILP